MNARSRTLLTALAPLTSLALLTALALPALGTTLAEEAPPQRLPADVARELLTADRTFGSAGATDDLVRALGRTFARDVVIPDRVTSGFARGRDAAIAVLRRDTLAARSRLQWTPIRAGVSADGTHGFTYGYTTLTRPDGTLVPGKYVAYWVREDGAWRVAVYRRVGRPAGDVSLEERAPALPPRLVAPASDAAAHRRLVEELAQAERDFSRDATGGPTIGAAFARYGDATAANVGNGASFTFGPDAIARDVAAGVDSTTRITWGPDETRVASSGDVGVTIGIITIERTTTAGAAPTPPLRLPYFTIWRRDGVTQPWRYVAE